MRPDDRWRSRQLDAAPWAADVEAILDAGLAAVEPGRLVREHLRAQRGAMMVGTTRVATPDRVMVIGAGKAVVAMTEAIVATLGDVVAGGVVIGVGEGDPSSIGPVEVLRGDHPIPGEASIAAGQALLAAAAAARPTDVVLSPISGGASAMAAVPAAGFGLDEVRSLTGLLLRSGAPIDELNAVRIAVDRLKGGGLARATAATVVTLVLSDVMDGGPQLVGSGPNAPDAFDPDALVRAMARLPPAPARRVARAAAARPEPISRPLHVVVGENATMVTAAAAQARALGWPTRVLDPLVGEARDAGKALAGALTPGVVIAGGETTVTVTGNGRGGRNQEVALGAVATLTERPGCAVVTCGSDGRDGPTDAAGAVATSETADIAARLGLDPAAALRQNDAYGFFDGLGDLLRPGVTGTNVCDLAVGVCPR